MIGAIIGDIVGSRCEFDDNNIKTKDFEFFHEDCEWTDDSLMTVAVAAALLFGKKKIHPVFVILISAALGVGLGFAVPGV